MAIDGFDPIEPDGIVFGGVAPLAEPSLNGGCGLLLEVEVDMRSGLVLAVYLAPDIPGLGHILWSQVVGRTASEAFAAADSALRSRYLSPYREAALAALTQAREAYEKFEKTAAASPETGV